VPTGAFRLGGEGPAAIRPPCRVGADTDAILGSLGFDATAIASLRASGVI
jgi:crotonobetainyl-CoA:carnitine CoA-transferase CaiB-like acyl-CoA transferase